MQYNNEKKLINSVSAAGNRFEALKALSQSILREVDSLRLEENVAVSPKINLAEEVQNYEADLIRWALLRCGGKQRRAAKLLGVKVTTLNSKIKRLGVELISVNNARG
jgi:transcriptional regulator with GAF, ATPase, and Fis domain